MSTDFSQFPCNNCGWCCQRGPCSLGVYMGAAPKGPCRFLVDQKNESFFCDLVMRETDEVKKLAVQQLILAGNGCSHKFGPHPVSLLKTLLGLGLQVGSPQWQLAVEGTRREMQVFALESADPQSMEMALGEFEQFCREKEQAFQV